MSTPSPHPHWVLRRTDQSAVAVFAAAALAAFVGWWAINGGLHGNFIEIDRAEPLSCRFSVDINAAELPELMQLPGIGQALGQRIVESRRTAGPFADHADLRRVRGIGPKTLQRIHPYLRPMPGTNAR
jgi:competence protein ComEA